MVWNSKNSVLASSPKVSSRRRVMATTITDSMPYSSKVVSLAS
jgi:hypothetical protein